MMSEKIVFHSECGQKLNVGAGKAGHVFKCPKCKQQIAVPSSAAGESGISSEFDEFNNSHNENVHSEQSSQSTKSEHYQMIDILVFTPLVDKFGNSAAEKVAIASYKKETIDLIDFDNFLLENVYDIADEHWLHPAFR